MEEEEEEVDSKWTPVASKEVSRFNLTGLQAKPSELYLILLLDLGGGLQGALCRLLNKSATK